jgi:hypothetical protein
MKFNRPSIKAQQIKIGVRKIITSKATAKFLVNARKKPCIINIQMKIVNAASTKIRRKSMVRPFGL